MGMSLLRIPSHNGMAQKRGRFHGVWGRAPRGSGGVSPELPMAPTVEEGVKPHFLFPWSSGQSRALSCSVSRDRRQQQSWVTPALSSVRPDLNLSFWKDRDCTGGSAFICHCLWALCSASHGTNLLGDCWVSNCASQASVTPFLCCSWSSASRAPPHCSWLGATHGSGSRGGGAGLGVRKAVLVANVEAE